MPPLAAGRTRRFAITALVAGLLVVGLAPGAGATYRSIFDLPPDPVSQAIKGGTPEGLPGPGILDLAANFDRSLVEESESSQAVDMDLATTLNAIALSHASAVPFTVPEISDKNLVTARSVTASQFLLLVPEDVAAALVVGVPPLAGSLYDVLAWAREFRTRDIVEVQSTLEDEATLSGLALLANGFAFDPHALLEYRESVRGGTPTRALATSRPDPVLTQSATLPFVNAASAAAVGFRIPEPIEPLSIADFRLNNSDRGSALHLVDLPPERALLGIALKNNRIPVAPQDLLATVDELEVSRVDTVTIDYDLADTFNALMLGARAR